MHTLTRCSFLVFLGLAACSSSGSSSPSEGGAAAVGKNPDTAPVVSVDPFSDGVAHPFKRSASSALPAANAPIDFDQGPFVTHGLGPGGERVTCYNCDVLPAAPAPIYVFFREGSATELTEQLHVIDALPGEAGYNDFWRVTNGTVPPSYDPNSAPRLADIKPAGFAPTPAYLMLTCPGD